MGEDPLGVDAPVGGERDAVEGERLQRREAVDQVRARIRRDAGALVGVPHRVGRCGSSDQPVRSSSDVGLGDRRLVRLELVAADELAVALRDVEQDGALVDEAVERNLRDLDAVAG